MALALRAVTTRVKTNLGADRLYKIPSNLLDNRGIKIAAQILFFFLDVNFGTHITEFCELIPLQAELVSGLLIVCLQHDTRLTSFRESTGYDTEQL